MISKLCVMPLNRVSNDSDDRLVAVFDSTKCL